INAIAAPLDEVVRYLESNPEKPISFRRGDPLWSPALGKNHQPEYLEEQRATVKTHPTSTQQPSPLHDNEGNDSYIVGAPLAGALGDGMGAPWGVMGTPRDGVGTLGDRMGAIGSWLIDPLDGLSDLQ